MIQIANQNFLSEPGKRPNNEDNYGFIDGSVYILCDGVGGNNKGEIASEIVVGTFLDLYSSDPNMDVEKVLVESEKKLSYHIERFNESAGMATTLAFSKVLNECIQIAWVGDSRVYQFRDGRIIFKTTDHSWVNDALKAGILTDDEAINHPKSNIITRAVQGIHKPVSIDLAYLKDLKKGDVIFHCSDGILESWDDSDLCALFSSGYKPDDIILKLKEECLQNSKDNFTSIFYTIGEINQIKVINSNLANDIIDENVVSPKQNLKKKYILFISFLVIGGFIALALYKGAFQKIFSKIQSVKIQKKEIINQQRIRGKDSGVIQKEDNGKKN